jgi:hypothetical protein
MCDILAPFAQPCATAAAATAAPTLTRGGHAAGVDTYTYPSFPLIPHRYARSASARGAAVAPTSPPRPPAAIDVLALDAFGGASAHRALKCPLCQMPVLNVVHADYRSVEDSVVRSKLVTAVAMARLLRDSSSLRRLPQEVQESVIARLGAPLSRADVGGAAEQAPWAKQGRKPRTSSPT